MKNPCKIREVESGLTVAEHAYTVSGFLDAGMGMLMREFHSRFDGLIFPHTKQVHMFFMRIPLDVLFIDGSGTVIKHYQNLQPWRISGYFKTAQLCIELPAGVKPNLTGKTLEIVS